MRSYRTEAVLGALATLAVLGVLAPTAGLGPSGWLVGVACGGTATALLLAGRRRRGEPVLPPDRITLFRALLGAGAAALVFSGRPLAVPALVAVSSVALVLDSVDGRVARRTGTVTPFGARFDGDVDAFLILVLSVAVARDHGGWVLAIGLARWVFLVAGWVVPWLAAPLPPRYWGKVVAVVQGVVLTVAVSGVLPRVVGVVAVGTALVLLAESFGRSVVLLYRAGAGPRTRRTLRVATALVAGAVVWAVLLAPVRLDQLTPAAFARIPLEALVLVAVGLVLPARARRIVAVLAGGALALLAVLELLDAAFTAQLDRPFNAVLDWDAIPPAIGVVRDSLGTPATVVAVGAVGVGLALLLALVVASTVRLSGATAAHRRRSARGLGVVGLVWALCAALSVQLAPTGPVASTSATGLAVDHGREIGTTLRDRQRFTALLEDADPFAGRSDLLTGLRGTDVLLVFVESYGRVALDDPSIAPGVTAVVRDGAARLTAAGFAARSAYLGSSTFGGYSWLAHGTLQSGLWVDDQARYDRLLASDRLTLSRAFGEAGWRTVGVNPANGRAWPEGRAFYDLDRLYGRFDLGYEGPTFSWAKVPDQFTLAAFQRLELGPGHAPVMAEIDLVSSHQPWTPLPSLVPPELLGDGSIFDPMPARGLSPEEAWQDPKTVRRLYGASIEYSLRSLLSWVAELPDDDLLIVLLGDHQPLPVVSGRDATAQVPVSVVASDPTVLDRIAGWGWQEGLLPTDAAPVWPMDDFRDRFVAAFTPTAGAQALRAPR